MPESTYLCIDLKSFYASVECVERGLDPMTARLVVAHPMRPSGSICLAVSPALKKLGVRNRCRVFEIPKSIDYIMAVPRMKKYIDYSAEIYGIYLEYFSPEDIYVYSVDEAFLDVTHYLKYYGRTGKEMGLFLMEEIRRRLGLRATCGVGTNLYLTKIALDIMAKHAPDFVGELDEETYRKRLWDHRPLTDFWRIGPGIQRRLAEHGMHTMREIAQAPEDWIYRLFGVDGELLIDHAWGREPVTMRDLKAYKPRSKGLSNGQLLPRDYSFTEGKTIIKEMVTELCQELTAKHLVTPVMSLYIGYGSSSGGTDGSSSHGHTDAYGGDEENMGDGGSVTMMEPTNAEYLWIPAMVELYEKIADSLRTVRRVQFACSRVEKENCAWQMSLFDYTEEAQEARKRQKLQQAALEIQGRYGKDAMLKGIDFEEGAMTRTRNHQIGGHKSGE